MDRETLLAGGFVPTTYEGQAGEFLVKSVPISSMPYAGEHLVDNDMVYPEFTGITEVIPVGMVQMYIPEADYLEGPVPLESDEGQALLRDALAAG